MQIVGPSLSHGTSSDAANVQRIVFSDFGKDESGAGGGRFRFNHAAKRASQGALAVHVVIEPADIFRPEVEEAGHELTGLRGVGNHHGNRNSGLPPKDVRCECVGL